MAKAKKRTAAKTSQPTSFAGSIRGHSASVRKLAKALRELVYEELPDAEESFYGGRSPMAIYRTTAQVCWIQPQNVRCNLYFTRGTELTDDDGFLKGTGKTSRHAKIRSIDDIPQFPLRAWIKESVELNEAAILDGISFKQVMEKLRTICLAFPDTKETLTWGNPHFRVEEKIFCGCGEERGRASIGMKAEVNESRVLMKLPGITKAQYSRKDDGWIAIDACVFDDWEEIAQLLEGSYRLVAPKRTVALWDSRDS